MEKIKFKVGTRLRILLSSKEKPLESIFIGVFQEEYLLIRLSDLSAVEENFKKRLTKGKAVNIQYFYEGIHHSFLSYIIGTISTPTPLLFITYPSKVKTKNLRKYPRIPCHLPTRIKIGVDLIEGVIGDISKMGCQIDLDPSKVNLSALKSGQEVGMMVHLPGISDEVYLAAEIKRLFKDRYGLHMGTAFNEFEIDIKAKFYDFLLKIGGLPHYYELITASLKNTLWTSYLNSVLDSRPETDLDEPTPDLDDQCELCRWISEHGMKKYDLHIEMREIEKYHDEMHKLTHKIMDLNANGKHAMAKSNFSRIEELSEMVSSLFTRLESRLSEFV